MCLNYKRSSDPEINKNSLITKKAAADICQESESVATHFTKYIWCNFSTSSLRNMFCSVFTLWVPCCGYDSTLPLVVCRMANVLFVFVSVYWCPTHIALCFSFVFLRLVDSMLPVSLDCPFFSVHLRYSLTLVLIIIFSNFPVLLTNLLLELFNEEQQISHWRNSSKIQ